jgi:hypothetical protein
MKFGVEVDPQFGSTLCFWRGSVDGWMGHVGYYWAEDATTFLVLGGNQSDAVTITRMPKSRFLGARWPRSVPTLNIIARVTNSSISVSTKED